MYHGTFSYTMILDYKTCMPLYITSAQQITDENLSATLIFPAILLTVHVRACSVYTLLYYMCLHLYMYAFFIL